jgi:membrane protein DedA with SNARE-associated domain
MSDWEVNHEVTNSRLGTFLLLSVVVAGVWAVVIFAYRMIMGFWDVEDVWEMPYRTYTYIISLITIVATIAVLIKIKRADDAALEESED